jgi:DNA-binding response OmpR family regulator
MLTTQTFDVVVSDFNMPGPSGFDVLNKIRLDHPEMILVLITAYGTDALEEGVRQLGAGYITKPFEPSFLVQKIKGLIQGQEAKRRTENVTRVMDELGKPAGSSSSIPLGGQLHE